VEGREWGDTNTSVRYLNKNLLHCKSGGIFDQIPEEFLKTRGVTQDARVASGQTKNRAEGPDRYPLSKPNQEL
jgi:hypothetical protein